MISRSNEKKNLKLRNSVIMENDLEMNDSKEESKERDLTKSSNMIFVSLLVLVWYSSSVFAITTSKKTMIEMPLPFVLCTFQFVASTVISGLIAPILNISFPQPLPKGCTWVICGISMMYTLGFIFTNMAFSVVSASFAETIKSGEPISSVILGYIFLYEKSSMLTYMSLLPVCLGVSISCISDYSFSILGFTLAMLSNICFSGRAVGTKYLNKTFPGCLDEIYFFHYISKVGIIILIPCVFIFERTKILHLYKHSENSLYYILVLLILNGLCFSCYNLVSYLVLSRTALITHAVLNVFRRVVVIIFTSFYFGVTLHVLNVCGIILACVGVLAFAYSKLN